MSYQNFLTMTKMLAAINDSRLDAEECPIRKEKSRLFNWIICLLALKTQECVPAQKSFSITVATDVVSSHITTLTCSNHYYYSENIFGSNFLNIMEGVSKTFEELNSYQNGYTFYSAYTGSSYGNACNASITIKVVKN